MASRRTVTSTAAPTVQAWQARKASPIGPEPVCGCRGELYGTPHRRPLKTCNYRGYRKLLPASLFRATTCCDRLSLSISRGEGLVYLSGLAYAGSWIWTFENSPSTHSGE